MSREDFKPATLKCLDAYKGFERWLYVSPGDGRRDIEIEISEHGVYFEVRGELILPLEELEYIVARAVMIREEVQR